MSNLSNVTIALIVIGIIVVAGIFFVFKVFSHLINSSKQNDSQKTVSADNKSEESSISVGVKKTFAAVKKAVAKLFNKKTRNFVIGLGIFGIVLFVLWPTIINRIEGKNSVDTTVPKEISITIPAHSKSQQITLRTGYNLNFVCPDGVTWTTNTSSKEYKPGDTGKKADYMIFHNKNDYPVEFVGTWKKR